MKRLFGSILYALATYALRFHALGSQGTVGFFGLAKEATWGTAVSATDYGEILSETMGTTIDRFGTRNVYAGFYEADDYEGMYRSQGGIVMAAFPGMLGHLLKGTFQQNVVTTVLSGFLWRNNFTNPRSEFADGVPRQPYTLEIFRDVVSSHIYAGANVNKLTLALAPNQDLRVTAEFIAKSRRLSTKTVPTFPGSPSDPFTFETASIGLAGVGNARFEAFTMTIDNQLEGIASLNLSNEIARIRASNPQMVRVSGTLEFADVTEQEDFINQTERSIILNITRSQSFNLLMSLPRFVYTSHAANISGRGRLTASFEGMARYQVTSLTSIGIELTTVKSNY